MPPMIEIAGLTKRYASGLEALRGVDLTIEAGEIFALLGPNGAGKTTLIHAVCGLTTPTTGTIRVNGHDVVRDFRAARASVGLVPQELHTDMFETVWATVTFSRALFGRPTDRALVERVLRDVALWEKRDQRIMTLSGGMKRRVLIAKALAHEPRVLFLDEPTAGVDVELRQGMWRLVQRLRDQGVTIILTTHYIHEAEELADRVGVISGGRLLLVEGKRALMERMGQKQLTLHLDRPLDAVPEALAPWRLTLKNGGTELEHTFDAREEATAIPALLRRMGELGLAFTDLNTRQSSLEDILVGLTAEAR